jgi:hypothetical protein
MAGGTAPSRARLVKIVVPVLVIAAAGFAFWRSVRSARAAPYFLTAATGRRPWRLVIQSQSQSQSQTRPNEPVLVLEAPAEVSRELFDQVFKRSMESMRAPELTGIPLVLAGELERGGQRIPADALVEMARAAGLESTPPTPRCIVHRRAPEPDARQQVYLALFDSPALATFRANLAVRFGPSFDAAALPPALFVGLVESPQQRWLPLHLDAEKDCLAPITIATDS